MSQEGVAQATTSKDSRCSLTSIQASYVLPPPNSPFKLEPIGGLVHPGEGRAERSLESSGGLGTCTHAAVSLGSHQQPHGYQASAASSSHFPSPAWPHPPQPYFQPSSHSFLSSFQAWLPHRLPAWVHAQSKEIQACCCGSSMASCILGKITTTEGQITAVSQF